MADRKYDPTLPYRYLQYGRMSDPKRQNKRSPDQQFNTIEETILRSGYPWVHVKTYRDDGISGRLVGKRPGLQQLLRDIEIGLVRVDLIVVDTYERLGRAEEIAEIRRKLAVEYGVLVVCADNGFSDPTGIVGQAVAMVEQIRSTDNTRLSRHNVLRGKKDAARRHRWPGGSPPFGFQLKAIVDESVSPPHVFHVLEFNDREAAAQKLAFDRAAATGDGMTRMSQWWNSSSDIPDDFKPISPTTMGYRLSNTIYRGALTWGANCTFVVSDTRVVEENPDGGEIVEGFCPSLIADEVFEQVQKLRLARSHCIRESRRRKSDAEGPAKIITAQVRGLTLKYLLTGLLRCGCCNSSLRPMPSGRLSKAGKRYVYYACPRNMDHSCPNGRYIPEDQIREAVVKVVRTRLLPSDSDDGSPPWLPNVISLVRQVLQQYGEQEPSRAEARNLELEQAERQLAGWTMTLGDPDLPTIVRNDIVTQYEVAKLRTQELEQASAAERAIEKHVSTLLDEQLIQAKSRDLAVALAGFSPTLANLELSNHVEQIVCHPDGHVEIRGTYLGVFEGAAALMNRSEAGSGSTSTSSLGRRNVQVVPRRRGRLRIPSLTAENARIASGIDTTLDPQRFKGLPEQFFWTERFSLARKLSWAEENAIAVAEERLSKQMTVEELANHFKRSAPTIRVALRVAEELDERFRDLPRKMPRSRWAEDHAMEVAQLKARGMSTDELATRFQKSDTTIRAALKYAKSISAFKEAGA